MIIERFVNAFNQFVKKINQIDMKILDISIYQNVMSNTSVASRSTIKSFILILNFVTFRSSEKFEINIRMR